MQRTFEVKLLSPFARHFDVYAVNRGPGLAPGATMAEIATQHAEAFREAFGEPVERDNVYGIDLLKGTADGVPDGRLIVHERASHASSMTDKRLGNDVAAFLLGPDVVTGVASPRAAASV